MATYIYTQFQVNGNVNAYGGIFIGQYGADPQDSANALTVYLDEELTQPVNGFNIPNTLVISFSDVSLDGCPDALPCLLRIGILVEAYLLLS